MFKTGSSKKIIVLSDNKAKEVLSDSTSDKISDFPNLTRSKKAKIKTIFSADDDYSTQAIFQIELLSSDKKLGANNNIFKNISRYYNIQEVQNS